MGKRRGWLTGTLMVLPCFLFVLIFIGYPLFQNVFLSFHQYAPFISPETIYVGLANYQWLVAEPVFLHSLYITVLFTMGSVFIELCIGLFIAILLVNLVRGEISGTTKWFSGFLRSSFLLPWAIPGVAAAVAWRMLYHPMFSPINALLGTNIMWLSDPSLSLFSIIIADVWKTTPFFIFIFLAGILSIPQDRFEAIKVDGASGWQEFRRVTLPSILPLILITFVFRAIDAFTKIFDTVYILTGGGPGAATEVLPLLIFRTAFNFFRFGRASALAVVVIIISILFGIVMIKRGK